MTKRLRMVLSLLLICAMILPSNYVSAAATEQGDIPVTDLSVVNPGYYDCFTIAPDSNKQVKVKVAPQKAANKTLDWKSSNKSIVTVTDKGLIHGVTRGKAEITVSTTDGSNKTITIPVVVGVPVTKIVASIKNVTITEGEKAKVTAKVKPADATNKELIWKSSNPKIATVSNNGEITAVSEGKTNIYVVSKDGSNCRASIAVTVKSTNVSQTLTDKDVIDGKITVKDKILRNLTIDSSVGDAEITLENVTVRGNLEMANGAKYTVYAKDSEINNVVALEEKIEGIQSFALASESSNSVDAPTFIAEKGTLVVTVDARGNVTVKQEDSALIGTISVNRTLDGNIELNLEGFSGNLVVNTSSIADIEIITSSCNIAEATVSGTFAGQKLTLQDNTADGKQSSIDKINVETNAEVKVDVPVKELSIADSIEAAQITIEKPIETIVNSGKATNLVINSNVSNIESVGEALEMKITAGSEVAEVKTSGTGTKIDVALGSTVKYIESAGDNASIGGNGTIDTVLVKGNDTVIDNKTASVSVDANVEGTKANGADVTGGTKIETPGSTTGGSGPSGSNTAPTVAPTAAPTTTPATTPTTAPTTTPATTPTTAPSTTPTTTPATTPTTAPTVIPTIAPTVTPTIEPTATPTPTQAPSENKTIITIADPGKIYAGTTVQLSADMSDISWSVYGYIDDTYGWAWIEEDTGILHPQYDGNVRIVATSKKDSKVYGAVDVMIYGKKFVKALPLQPVTINKDSNLASVVELKKSQILPTQMDLVYETGNGAETETITVDLNNSYWGGAYDGSITGTYILSNYVDVPSGYERPSDLRATVKVTLNTEQTDLRKELTGFDALDDIILTTDENLISFYEVYSKYLSEKTVTLNCADGTTAVGKINGWYAGGADEFNGTVTGTYPVLLYLQLPENYYYNEYNKGQSSIYWYETSGIQVPVNIRVQQPQTIVENTEPYTIPDTTQPKYTVDITNATIKTVTLTGAPTSVKVGESINFNKFLTVDTDSQYPSAKRVIWSVSGYDSNLINRNTGEAMFTYSGSYTITATSAVDKSKFSTIQVSVTNIDTLTLVTMTPITVNEDKGIVDFTSLYTQLKDVLPKYIMATNSTNQQVKGLIHGWYLTETTAVTMTIIPQITWPIGYGNEYASLLPVNFTVAQTDNRIKVKSYSVITSEYSLNEDRYAVTENELFDEIFGNIYDARIAVNAVLEDDTEVVLQCGVANWVVKPETIPNGYYGKPQDLTFTLGLSYPQEYAAMDKNDVLVDIKVHINAEQTPAHELLWVEQQPKTTYKIGDKLDLTGMILRIRDTSFIETKSESFIGPDKLADYGIVLKLGYYGSIITAGTVITQNMIGEYIYVFNTKNDTYTYYGPITLESSIITGFIPITDSNGAVGAMYIKKMDDYLKTLPDKVTSTDGIDVPVLGWTPNEDTSKFGQEEATYTFTATLGTLPIGCTLADGVKATAKVTVAKTLSIEAIQKFQDITLPVNFEQTVLHLPGPINVTLSDGYTSYKWMPVVWDLSSFDATKEGTYIITGTMLMPPTSIINVNNLTPTIKVTVHKEKTATPTGLEIVRLPYKLLYKQGEQLDTSGMRIVENYSDGSSVEVVTGAAISAFDNTTVGIQELTVTYQGDIGYFNVCVDSMDIVDNTVLFVSDSLTMEYVNVATGSAISYLPSEPQFTGYAFSGWSSEGYQVTQDTVPTHDMVVYAVWERLDIVDFGIDSYENSPAVQKYALFRAGNKLMLSSVDDPNVSIVYGDLGIDLYSMETGWYNYIVTDNNGNSYQMTIYNEAPPATTAVNTGTKITIDQKDYITYDLGVDGTLLDFVTVYSYETDAMYEVDTNNNILVYMPTNAVAGTYRFVIDINGILYKTSIVIK